jgi:hypothetical protein
VAEECAMPDVISGGRLVGGFRVGTSMDMNDCDGAIPGLTRETCADVQELIICGWKDDAPCALNGGYAKLRPHAS